VTVVMEPTRNAWVPLAAWFRRHGARVILVPSEQSASGSSDDGAGWPAIKTLSTGGRDYRPWRMRARVQQT
jgi:hypothetical protein